MTSRLAPNQHARLSYIAHPVATSFLQSFQIAHLLSIAHPRLPLFPLHSFPPFLLYFSPARPRQRVSFSLLRPPRCRTQTRLRLRVPGRCVGSDADYVGGEARIWRGRRCFGRDRDRRFGIGDGESVGGEGEAGEEEGVEERFHGAVHRAG